MKPLDKYVLNVYGYNGRNMRNHSYIVSEIFLTFVFKKGKGIY